MKTFQKDNKTYAKRQDLTLWQDNPRDIDPKRMEALIESIKEYRQLDPESEGQFKPLLVTPAGLVIGGNMRMRAYEKLGIEDVYITVAKTENPKQAFKLAIRDNERFGFYIEEKVAEMAIKYELDEIEMDQLQIDTGEVKTIAQIVEEIAPDPEVDEDEVPELPETAESKKGKVYQLGSHRLMCGDSTSETDMAKLMAGKKANMVFTDPPYNVNYSGRGKKTSTKIENDDMSPERFAAFLDATFNTTAQYLHKEGALYTCYASRTHREFENALEGAGFKVKNQIIWVKPVASMGWGDYRWKHEPILYASFEGKAVDFYGDRKQYTEWQFEPDDKELLDWAKSLMEHDENTTVWRINRDINYEHPTQKPVKLPAKAILNSSKSGQLVLDPFAGGGTTLIAAEQTGRICHTMELDERWVDVVRKRYAKYINRADDWQAATPEVG